MSVTLNELEKKYLETADPWGFHTSAYEQEKFSATRDALGRERYASAVELGCGNGALAERLAPLCNSYLGIDGVERAVLAARQAVPDARFIHKMFPCSLPDGDHDLIILSEILYFLDEADIDTLATQIWRRWPHAEIICVTYLGETGHILQGEDALQVFIQSLGPTFAFTNIKTTPDYRIDRRPGQEENR